MEIKNAVNKIEKEYPTMKQVNKKHLLKTIPNKWKIIGLSSIIISIIMKSNVFAKTTLSDLDDIAAGFEPIPQPSVPEQICINVCPKIQVISAIIFIITTLNIIITKLKYKGQKKINKWIKFLFILSIIIFVLNILAKFIIDIIYS